jgi:hypothetical protein
MSDRDVLTRRFQDASDIASLLKEAKILAEQMLFHVMSCWESGILFSLLLGGI